MWIWTSVSDLYTHISMENNLSSVFMKSFWMTVWNWFFSVWKYNIVCCLWCVHNRSLDNRKKRFVICYFKFLPVLSIKYTALFNVLFYCRLRIDIFITIFAYSSHLARPYSIQKRLFSFSINDIYT